MSEILLINPPFSRSEEYRFWISSLGTKANPPLGLASIAAVCLEKGYDVEIVDALAEALSWDKLRGRIIKANPRIAGVTATTPMITNALKVIALVKQCAPNIITVLGGPHVTAEAVSTMNECADLDVAVVGEGEETFLELAQCFLNVHKDINSIPGIIYRQGNRIIGNYPRSSIEDINILPMPAYHLLPTGLYSPSPLNYRKKPALPVICSRGCPFNCLFCTKCVFGNSLRRLSASKVYKQVKSLVENYRAREVHFYDEAFTLDKEWVREVCGYLEKLGIFFWCNGRADSITAETLGYLKKAGCYRIYYGVESGNEKSLQLLKKGECLNDIRKAFKLTREAKIETGAFMMLGIPGEDGCDMQRSIDFVREIKADHAVFTMLTPYPGTEIYADYARYGTMRKASWSEFVMISQEPVFVPFSTTQEELKRYLRQAYSRFIFSPRFIMNKIKDILYAPEKLYFYAKGLLLALLPRDSSQGSSIRDSSQGSSFISEENCPVYRENCPDHRKK